METNQITGNKIKPSKYEEVTRRLHFINVLVAPLYFISNC